MPSSTYIFAGGGSGGHLYPGIAVARELLAFRPGVRVVFVGSERAIERRILAVEQFEHVALPTASSAELTRNPLQFARRNWAAFREAQRLIVTERPSAVVGLGGFASVPAVLAARRAGLPTLLLEQNVTPGRATRWLSARASVVCLSFPDTSAHLPRSACCVVTGNPIRRDIAALHNRSTEQVAESARKLLILGGSQGARRLNQIVCASLPALRGALADWEIVHQTGPADESAVRESYLQSELRAGVVPFIQDLSRHYSTANLAVSRAGATTLAELVCCGLPSVLIPFRHAARDHQTANAAWYVARGAALQIRESVESAGLLADALIPLLRDETLRRQMSEQCRATARPHAARDVAQQLLAVAHRAAA